MAVFHESVRIRYAMDNVRKLASQPNTLVTVVPALSDAQRTVDGAWRCTLTLDALPQHVTTWLAEDGSEGRAELFGTEPSHRLVVDFVAPEPGLTRVDVEVHVDVHGPDREKEIRDAVRAGLGQLRVLVETRQDAPGSTRDTHDPLLHTGPRVPPDDT